MADGDEPKDFDEISGKVGGAAFLRDASANVGFSAFNDSLAKLAKAAQEEPVARIGDSLRALDEALIFKGPFTPELQLNALSDILKETRRASRLQWYVLGVAVGTLVVAIATLLVTVLA